MKHLKNSLICSVLFLSSLSASSQDSIAFKPSGKIIGKGFFDYSTGFGKKNTEAGFDITRAFLGYNYKFTKKLQAQVVTDCASGHNDQGGLDVYLRNAFVSWDDKKLSVSAGLIGLLQFNTQEKYWAHRYVLKSFQDLNKMGSSVDAGITASYALTPYLSVDISFLNGEGYKKIVKNNSTRYGLGLTLSPIKNMAIRAYGDVYNDGEDMRDPYPSTATSSNYKNQYALALFAGYQNDAISVGAEYNRQYNKGFIGDKDCYGYSLYSTVKVAPKCNVYGRYDSMDSSAPSSIATSWNKLDGQLTIVGAEFQIAKQLKISPNLRNINAHRAQAEQYLFLNVEFNL